MLSLSCKFKQKCLFDIEILIEYWASVVNAVSYNPSVGSIPRIKIFSCNYSFFLSLLCTDQLISTPKMMTFLPTLPSGNENSERESNPII